MAENRLTLQNGYIYSYNGTDGRYSLVFGGINEAIVDDLIISGSSYLGDSSADRVEVTGSLKARNITGSIHTVDGNSPFLVAGSGITANFSAGTGQWTLASNAVSTPGGAANQVQLANSTGTSFSGSGGFWFTSAGNNLHLSGNLVTAGNINANANTPRSIFSDVVNITLGSAASTTSIPGNITTNKIQTSAGDAEGNIIIGDVAQNVKSVITARGSNNAFRGLKIDEATTERWFVGGANGGDFVVRRNSSENYLSLGTPGNITLYGTASIPAIQLTQNTIRSSNSSTAITLSGPSVTVGGDLQVSGNHIKSNTGAIALQLTGSSVTVGANLIVSGNTSLGNAPNDITTVVGQLNSRHITGSIHRVNENTLFLNAGSNVTTTFNNDTGQWTIASTAAGGTGDVTGPASALDNAVARFNLTTGKIIQNSGILIGDLSNGSISIDGEQNVSTLSMFSVPDTINFAMSDTADMAITIAGGSTKTGFTKRINIGVGGTEASVTRINLGARDVPGTSTGGPTIVGVSGSLAYKGAIFASNVHTQLAGDYTVADNVRYIRTAQGNNVAIKIYLPALSETTNGRVLTVMCAGGDGGTTLLSTSGGDKLVLLGTTDLPNYSITPKRFVEIVAKWAFGANDNAWYIMSAGAAP